MNKKDILKIIQELNEKQTETICIETKAANKGKPEKYYDTISSFANTIGGVILFGVEERKEKNKTVFIPAGVYDANDLQKNELAIEMTTCLNMKYISAYHIEIMLEMI